MKEFKLKGKNLTEKVKHIEKILQRFQRKLHKTVIGVIPPIPVQGHVDNPREDGTIAKHLVPASGRVIRGAVAVGKYNSKKAVQFYCSVRKRDGSVTTASFETKSPAHVVDLDLDINAGDMITISTPNAGDVEDVWYAVLYSIDIKESVLEKRLIDELERVTNEGV